LSPDEVAPRSFIIALTCLASLKDQKEAFAAGVDRYLMKPASFAKLSILLEEWQAEHQQGT
jgi:DNA-binding response OmpR family regulator